MIRQMVTISGALKWLIGILAAVLALWLGGILNALLPPPGQAWLAIENFSIATPPPSEHRFRVVLAWLENDNGDDTRIVEQAFASVEGIELKRSANEVKASGSGEAWRDTMQEDARAVLADWERRCGGGWSGQASRRSTEPLVRATLGHGHTQSRRPSVTSWKT